MRPNDLPRRRYHAYLAGEPVIIAFDCNPIVPLAVRPTLSTTLTALAKAVH